MFFEVELAEIKALSIIVRTAWHEDANVQVASSNDVEALPVEAEMLELLGKRLSLHFPI
ncbi:DUF1902 domain-containing protein [Rhizobium yanglingense]